MTPGLILIALLLTLLLFVIIHLRTYVVLKQQDNGTAHQHLGLAIVVGFFCIIFAIFLIANKDDFFSKNQSKQLNYERQSMQNNSLKQYRMIWPLAEESFFMKKPIKT